MRLRDWTPKRIGDRWWYRVENQWKWWRDPVKMARVATAIAGVHHRYDADGFRTVTIDGEPHKQVCDECGLIVMALKQNRCRRCNHE